MKTVKIYIETTITGPAAPKRGGYAAALTFTRRKLPALKKVQTNVVALITSLILTPVAVIVLCTYYQIVIEWYYIFASFIAAFIVYLVSTGGWERVTEMWNRNAYKKK